MRDIESTEDALEVSDHTQESPDASEGESSLAKMLGILELFSEAEPVWSTAAILEALEASRSTGYRYIKTLHDAGLLTAASNGRYSLGPRIIEMDLQIRQSDPLLLASEGVLEDLVGTIGHSALLCTAFRDAVLCVGEFRSPTSVENRFSRGQRRSFFRGAVAKAILAYLPHHRLKAIFATQSHEIQAAGMGATWSDFRSNLSAIKRDGFVLTKGEFNPGVYSVAAPILTDHKTSLGSVGVAWGVVERHDVDEQRATLAVRQAATIISERLMARERD